MLKKPKTRLGWIGILAGCIALVLLLLILFLKPHGKHAYLIYGVDQYGSLRESGRSDAMMLVQLDHSRGQTTVVSLARDMLIDNGRNGRTKINTVVRGNEENGGQALCDAIERNFGVKPEGWFRINFSSLVSIVDAMDGVEVDLSAEEAKYIEKNAGIYPDHPLHEGKCLLNGGQALSFVRCRHLDDDLGRGQRQSRFASAAAAKLRRLSPLKVLDLYRSMNHAWVSSLSASEQTSLVWQALWACRGKIVRLGLPFEGTWKFGNANGISGILPNLEENRRLLTEAFGETAK